MPPAGRPLLGVGLAAMAVLSFALGDALTKHLAERFPVPVVMALRYGVSLVFLTALFLPRMKSALWSVSRPWMVLMRGLVLAVASATMGLALQRMPLGETVAIIYLAPFAVLLLSAPVLGERVGRAAWLGAALGFAGVLLILRPGGGLDALGVVFALINAACSTAYQLMTRVLSRTETTMALLFQVTLTGAVIFGVLSLPQLPDVALETGDVWAVVGLGLASTLGHFLFTAAYREAPPSLLGPITYMHLVWAAGLGWVVFAHVPDALTICGIVLVAAAGAGTAWHAHRARARQFRPMPPV